MLYKMSRTRKKLLYALIGTSLALHSPFSVYAAELDASATGAEEQKTDTFAEQAEKSEFTFEGSTILGDREHQKSGRKVESYAGGQVAKKANLGILGDTDIFDTPFNITSYTEKVIEDQQARTLADVLENDPSVRMTTSSGHMSENFTIRGFDVNESEIALNGMFGLAPSKHVPTEFIERVEVLKGPSALLYGMSPSGAVGGSVNVVTKTADEEPLTRVTTEYTSKLNKGVHLDLGRRFGENKEWGMRFNVAKSDGATGVDDQEKDRTFGSINLDYQGEKIRAYLDAFRHKEDFSGGTAVMIQFPNMVKYIPDAPDGDMNLIPGAYSHLNNKGAMFRSEYDFNKNLTAYANIGYLKASYNGFINGTRLMKTNALGTGDLTTYNINGYTDTVSSEVGLRKKFTTGDVTHLMVLSASKVDVETGSINNASKAVTTSIYHPKPVILATDPSSSPKTADNTFTSVALADTLSFSGDKYKLMLGARNQQVETKSYDPKTGSLKSSDKDHALTPMIAFVVKPWATKSTSFYANYIEGLSAGTEVKEASAVNYGEILPTFRTKQAEVGVKWDAGTFANTVSLFQIEKPSSSFDDVTKIVSQDAKQRNKGVEWTSFGKVNDTIRFLGGITYMQGKLVKADYTQAKNSAKDGNTPYGVPKWQANLGFEFDSTSVPGLSFNTRIVYTGDQYVNSSNTLKAPSWIRYDAGMQYKTSMQGNPTTFRLSVENLTNKNYWSGIYNDGYLTIGSGRTYKLSMTMDL